MPSLESAYLDVKESRIYEALLHTGKMSIADISNHTKIKRSTVYLSIESLAEKGLAIKTISGKRVFYRPASPEKLLQIIASRKNVIDKDLPRLLSIYQKSSKQPEVRTYHGKSGLRGLYALVSSEAFWVKTIFSPKSFYTVFTHNESDIFAETLTQRGATLKSILVNDPVSKQLARSEKERKLVTRARLLPKGYALSINVLIWGDSVALISYENLFGTVIHNAEIARFHESIFDTYWNKMTK